MQVPLQISFRHLKNSAEIENLIREKADKLEQFADQLISCRVVVEPASRHHRNGNHYKVCIDARVPDDEFVAKRGPADNPEYKDLNLAIRDAFRAIRRQLEDYVAIRQVFVKNHTLL